MEYSIINQDNTKRVIFYGNIKPSTRSKFLEIGQEMASSDQTSWELDVSDFDHIDSAGLGMFLELRETAKTNNVNITITGASSMVSKMFTLSKFDELFTIID